MLGRDYSSSASWVFTPSAPGTYVFQVWVRNAGSTALYDAWATSGYVTIGPPSGPVVTVGSYPSAVFNVGTPITWTGSVTSGGTGPFQYRFVYYDENANTWTEGRPYGAAAVWTWTPPSEGRFVVQIWVRNAGSTATYDGWGTSGYITVNGASPPQASLTSAPETGLVAGIPATWTAGVASGGVSPFQYRFLYWSAATNTWVEGRDYASSPTWTWVPPAPGWYRVEVWIRGTGSTAAYDACVTSAMVLVSSG